MESGAFNILDLEEKRAIVMRILAEPLYSNPQKDYIRKIFEAIDNGPCNNCALLEFFSSRDGKTILKCGVGHDIRDIGLEMELINLFNKLPFLNLDLICEDQDKIIEEESSDFGFLEL